MKVLIFGVSGLVGNACAVAALRRGHSVTGTVHRRPQPPGVEPLPIDATDPDAVVRACLDFWPDAIVNAAAISSQAEVDQNPGLAERLNVTLPRALAQLSSHIGARLIHFSTDLVFSGRSVAPAPTTTLPDPSSSYGRTKLQAEREVLEFNTIDPVVLRITLVSGNSPSGERSVHEKLLHAIARGERPKLFEDEIRQPVSAENLAEVVVELIERRDLHGIFHWAGADALSRYEIAVRMLRHLGLPEDLIVRTRKADDPAYAGRPSGLRLDLKPLQGKLRTRPAPFQAILEEISVPVALAEWYQRTRQNS